MSRCVHTIVVHNGSDGPAGVSRRSQISDRLFATPYSATAAARINAFCPSLEPLPRKDEAKACDSQRSKMLMRLGSTRSAVSVKSRHPWSAAGLVDNVYAANEVGLTVFRRDDEMPSDDYHLNAPTSVRLFRSTDMTIGDERTHRVKLSASRGPEVEFTLSRSGMAVLKQLGIRRGRRVRVAA
jgi:hypothetical protein